MFSLLCLPNRPGDPQTTHSASQRLWLFTLHKFDFQIDFTARLRLHSYSLNWEKFSHLYFCLRRAASEAACTAWTRSLLTHTLFRVFARGFAPCVRVIVNKTDVSAAFSPSDSFRWWNVIIGVYWFKLETQTHACARTHKICAHMGPRRHTRFKLKSSEIHICVFKIFSKKLKSNYKVIQNPSKYSTFCFLNSYPYRSVGTPGYV